MNNRNQACRSALERLRQRRGRPYWRREAKVRELPLLLAAEPQHVLGLQVVVHDAGGVHRREVACDVKQHGQRGAAVGRRTLRPLVQRVACTLPEPQVHQASSARWLAADGKQSSASWPHARCAGNEQRIQQC